MIFLCSPVEGSLVILVDIVNICSTAEQCFDCLRMSVAGCQQQGAEVVLVVYVDICSPAKKFKKTQKKVKLCVYMFNCTLTYNLSHSTLFG